MAELTSVEWLERRYYFTKGQLIDIDFEQAKEMEKQQIIDFAVWFNNNDNSYKSYTEIIEQYYKEKFKK